MHFISQAYLWRYCLRNSEAKTRLVFSHLFILRGWRKDRFDGRQVIILHQTVTSQRVLHPKRLSRAALPNERRYSCEIDWLIASEAIL